MLHLMHPVVLVICELLSRNLNLETVFFLPLCIRRCNIDLSSHMQEYSDWFRHRLGKGQHETSVSRSWWSDARVFQHKMHLAEKCKLSCVRRYELLLADLRHSWIEMREGLGKETIWKQD